MLTTLLDRLREARLAESEGETEAEAEAGFTLIELMVVLLIIAILLAIAIPTFLGVTSGANDRAAQSNLTNALTEASAIYQNNGQAYPAAAATYQGSAPEFTWQTGASTAQGQISVQNFDVVQAGDSQGLVLAVRSNTDTCWYIVSIQQAPSAGGAVGDTSMKTAGTYYGETKNVAAGACQASNVTTNNVAVTGSSYSNASAV